MQKMVAHDFRYDPRNLVSMDFQSYNLQILHIQDSTYKLHFATCITTEPEGIPGDIDHFNTSDKI